MTVHRAHIVALLLVVGGCDREISFGQVAEQPGAQDGAAPGRDGADPAQDGAAPAQDGAAPAQDGAAPVLSFCAQRGPVVDVGDGHRGACGTSSRGHHFALCACGDLVSQRDLAVDGFDSARGAYAPGEASGAVGVNGSLFPHLLTLGGSLVVGSGGAALDGELTVGGNLSSAGGVQSPYAVRVTGDARSAGAVRLARIEVGGTFTLAPSAAFEPREPASTPLRAEVIVPAPCRCDEPPTLDVAVAVRAAAAQNDDALINLARDGLRLDAGGARSLPCGRYHVDSVFAGAPLSLRIEGRVALYVGEGILINPNGRLDLTLADGAELDLFVAGTIIANGPVALGDPRHPDRVRIYVGGGTGGDNIVFTEPSVLAASLYAPRSPLVSGAAFELYGAALVASAGFSQPARLHYDRALATDACAEARCGSDDDCAAPLRCDGARCLP